MSLTNFKKNNFISKPWILDQFSRWLVIGNLLFTYSIVFIILATCVGYKKMTNTEMNGCYVIDAVLFAVSTLILVFISLRIFNKKIPNTKYSQWLFFGMLLLPFVGAIVNYILLKQLRIIEKHHAIAKHGRLGAQKEPMSCQVLLILVTIFVVLVIWLVYACVGHTSTYVPEHTETLPDGQEYTVPGYNVTHVIPGIFDVILSPIKGFIDGAEIIVYLFVMGIFLQIVNSSKALEAGIGRLTKKLKNKELIIIPVIMLLFSVGGATFGMCEETIAFYSIVMPIVLAAGFDGITGVLIILFGAGLGVCSSIINPFMIMTSVDAVKQNLGLNLSTYDGMVFRILVYIVFLTIGITFVTLYAHKIKKDPKKSLVYEYRDLHIQTFKFHDSSIPELTTKRKITLIIFMMSFILLIIGAIPWTDLTGWNGFENMNNWLTNNFPFLATGTGTIGAWYLATFAFLFLTASFVIALMNWQGANHFLKECLTGAKDFFGVVVVIAIARGLSLLLTSSGVGDLIANGVTPILKVNDFLGTIILFIAFIVISIFIPSTSGFAYTVFGPIAAPAMVNAGMPSIASGIASTSITNGLINLSSPTAGPFVIGCEMAKVPLANFYKLAWKLLLILFIAGLVLLLFTCIPGMPTSIIGH